MSLLFPPNQLVNALIFYLLVFKDLKCIRARLCVCVCVCVCTKVTNLLLHESLLLGSPRTQEHLISSVPPGSGLGLGTKLRQRIQRVSVMLAGC